MHYHFKFEINPDILIPYWIICFIVFIYFTYDLPTALKRTIKQQLIIERKSQEFTQILSSLPQGILLASIKTKSEVMRQINRIELLEGIDQLTA